MHNFRPIWANAYFTANEHRIRHFEKRKIDNETAVVWRRLIGLSENKLWHGSKYQTSKWINGRRKTSRNLWRKACCCWRVDSLCCQNSVNSPLRQSQNNSAHFTVKTLAMPNNQVQLQGFIAGNIEIIFLKVSKIWPGWCAFSCRRKGLNGPLFDNVLIHNGAWPNSRFPLRTFKKKNSLFGVNSKK